MADKPKAKEEPHILYAVPPREGHMRPALQITKHLRDNGFNAAGACFSPILGLWNTLDDATRWPDIARAPSPAARLAASLDGGFVSLLPSGLESIRFALAAIRRRQPGCHIIVLSDTCFSGTLALRLQTDLPEGFEEGEEIRTIGIGVVPPFWTSPERPPWGSGLPLDHSEKGIKKNVQAIQEAWNAATEERARWVLAMMSCAKDVESLYDDLSPTIQHPFWDASTICHDTTLQMCLPSLEFRSSDWPEKIKFAGTLPIKPLPPNLFYPSWYSEILSNSATLHPSTLQRSRIVFVAQGTEVLDYRELVIPTMKALACEDDVLVVACLCVAGATLETHSFDDGKIPSNARVVDYFPYDAILSHSDVFVSNSGYGGFQHAVANGVPMVQAGEVFDKPDIGRRVEWSGLGVYIEESPPTVKGVHLAITKVLRDERYRKQAQELKKEAGELDPLKTVTDEILLLTSLTG
ncbi:UDP-glucuronosyl/UDP-glucosyltransferase [Colletotrichum caudatum]|nr:UDP-glucuronosyl/UDP-glucosyltransferase [Colletotrichum caudatum]